jgi:hypothetical protein
MEGKMLVCKAGHTLPPEATVEKMAIGKPLIFKVCQDCEDYEPHDPLRKKERGWIKP